MNPGLPSLAVAGWIRVVALRKCVVFPLGIRD